MMKILKCGNVKANELYKNRFVIRIHRKDLPFIELKQDKGVKIHKILNLIPLMMLT